MRAPLSRVRAGLCIALIAFSAAACGTLGVPLEEVTESPLALVYWDGPAARARAEVVDELQRGPGAGFRREGMASLDDVARLMGSSATASERLSRLPGRIILVNVRTLEQTRFAPAPPNARPLAWSKDRNKLLFSSDHLDSGRTQLFEYNSASGDVRKLTWGPVLHLEGDYGPDGQLLFNWVDLGAGEAGAGMDLRQSKGGPTQRVISGTYPSGPRVSPRDDALLYINADRGGGVRDRSEVVIKGLGNEEPISRLAFGRDAVFSPDGEWIVFSSQGSGGWRLHRMRPDGSARKPLGKSALSARWPAISPDGRHVAYISNEDGLDRLYLRRMDGTGDRILLEDGAVAFPVW